MATKQVTVVAPDGQKFTITAPADATDEQILAYAQQNFGSAAAQPRERTLGETALGASRAFQQGAFMGWADELEANTEATLRRGKERPAPRERGLGFVDTVRERLSADPRFDELEREAVDRIRDEQAQFASENPVSNFGLNLAGGVLPFIATRGLAAPVQAARTPPRLATTGLGALTGATTGAVAGAGAADDTGRGRGALTGGIFGGIFGGATPAVMAGARSARGTVRNLFKGELPEEQITTRAQDLILKMLGRDRMSPDDASKRAADMARVGVEDFNLADMGANMRARLGLSARTPGVARSEIEENLNARAGRLGPDLQTAAERAAGLRRTDTTALNRSLVRQMREAARPAYEAAYATGFARDPRIFSAMTNAKGELLPQFRGAFREAQKLAEMEGRKLNIGYATSEAGQQIPVFDVRTLDDIKGGMDALIERQRDSVTGRLTEEGKILVADQRRFLNLIDEAVPEYGAARAQYAGDRAMIDALKLGREALRMGADDWREFAEEFRSMLPAERNAALAGLVDDIGLQIERRAQVSGSTRAPDVTNLLTSQQAADRLRALLPTPQAFDDFMANVTARSRQMQTRNAALTGSPTSEMRQEAAEVASEGLLDDIISSASQGRVMPALVGGARRFVDERLSGITEPVQRKVAQALTLTGPDLQRYLATLTQRERDVVLEQLERAGKRINVATAAGGVAGRENTQGRYEERR